MLYVIFSGINLANSALPLFGSTLVHHRRAFCRILVLLKSAPSEPGPVLWVARLDRAPLTGRDQDPGLPPPLRKSDALLWGKCRVREKGAAAPGEAILGEMEVVST